MAHSLLRNQASISLLKGCSTQCVCAPQTSNTAFLIASRGEFFNTDKATHRNPFRGLLATKAVAGESESRREAASSSSSILRERNQLQAARLNNLDTVAESEDETHTSFEDANANIEASTLSVTAEPNRSESLYGSRRSSRRLKAVDFNLDMESSADTDVQKSISMDAQGLRAQKQTHLRRNTNLFRYPGRVVNCLRVVNDKSACSKGLEAQLESFKGTLNAWDMMAILKEIKEWEAGLEFFEWMKKQDGLSPEVIHYNLLLKKASKLCHLAAVESMVTEMQAAGLKPDKYTYSSLISSASRCGAPVKAIDWFYRMQDEGEIPDQVTYCTMMNTLGRAGRLKEGAMLFTQMKKKGWKLDGTTYGTAIQLYVRWGKWKEAVSVLRDMEAQGLETNEVAYCTLISGFARSGMAKQTIQFMEEMKDKGIKPNSKSAAVLVVSYGKIGNIESALRTFEEHRSLFGRDTSLYNNVLQFCRLYRLFEKGQEVFAQMRADGVRRDEVTRSIMIRLYAESGQLQKALGLIKSMKKGGKPIDNVAFTALMWGLADGKKVGQIEEVMKEMREDALQWASDRLSMPHLLRILDKCQNAREAEHFLYLAKEGCSSLYDILTAPEQDVAEVRGHQTADNPLVPRGQGRLDYEAFLRSLPVDERNQICNLLINVLWTVGFQARAAECFYAGRATGAYKGLFSVTSVEWILHLKPLTTGPCQVAFRHWLKALDNHLREQDGKQGKRTKPANRNLKRNIFMDWGFENVKALPAKVRIEIGLEGSRFGLEEGVDAKVDARLLSIGISKVAKAGVGERETLAREDDVATTLQMDEEPCLEEAGEFVRLRSVRAVVVDDLKALGSPFRGERGPGREGWVVASGEEVRTWLNGVDVHSVVELRDSLVESFNGWPNWTVERNVDRMGWEGNTADLLMERVHGELEDKVDSDSGMADHNGETRGKEAMRGVEGRATYKETSSCNYLIDEVIKAEVRVSNEDSHSVLGTDHDMTQELCLGDDGANMNIDQVETEGGRALTLDSTSSREQLEALHVLENGEGVTLDGQQFVERRKKRAVKEPRDAAGKANLLVVQESESVEGNVTAGSR